MEERSLQEAESELACCPRCGYPMALVSCSRAEICPCCGFKDCCG